MTAAPIRTITSETRVFRLRDIGVEPVAVRAIPGGKLMLLPDYVDLTYRLDVCPARPGEDTWGLQRIAVSGPAVGKDRASSSSGRIYWTLGELREDHPELADFVAADATEYLTERRGEPVRMNENGVLRRG